MDITPLIGARPVGTERNREVLAYLKQCMDSAGYRVRSLETSCQVWDWNDSFLDGYPIHPSPFSLAVHGRFPVLSISSRKELLCSRITGKIILLHGDIVREPLMPKEFPFYYPDEHREMNDYLESHQPAGVVALTGKHPMCGMNPYPLFEDSTLMVPTAYGPESLVESVGTSALLNISSRRSPASTVQLVAQQHHSSSGAPVVICSHMDTKYETPGVLDNAAGVAVMLSCMTAIGDRPKGTADFEFIPFNGEEYCGVPGQLAYLDDLKQRSAEVRLVLNIDGVLLRDSPLALSWYNMDESREEIIGRFLEDEKEFVRGEPWYAGDHSVFAFQGIPCLALTSADFDRALSVTHTESDTLACIDQARIEIVGEKLADLLSAFMEA